MIPGIPDKQILRICFRMRQMQRFDLLHVHDRRMFNQLKRHALCPEERKCILLCHLSHPLHP